MPAARRSLTTRDVRRLVEEQCFPPSPSGRVGVEVEWLAVCLADPTKPVRHEVVGEAGAELAAGSRLTYEPGGQVELSSPPLRGIGPACASIAADAAALSAALGDYGIGLVGLGLDPGPARPRCVDSPRYEAMEAYFDAQCAAGRTMMRSTAAVQVNVDLGPTAADAARRWHRAHDAGPLLAAAFANSPLSEGAPSGWRSRRLAVWTDVDECRTTAADGNGEPDPVRQWTEYALAARVMFIRRDESRFVPILEPLTLRDWIAHGHELGFPTLDDVSYHFTTLFPPVRPRGWLEMRMIDSLPDPWWRAAVAVATTLVCDDTAAAEAAGAIAPTAGRWLDAARHGLGHPDFAGAARDAFDVALRAMVRLGTDATTVLAVEAFVDRYVAPGRCPADDRLEAWQDDGTLIPEPDQFRGGDVGMTVDTESRIEAGLGGARARTLALLAPIDDADLVDQVSPLMSPLAWDLAHIGHYEELWLLRNIVGAAPTNELFDDVYDAFKHPRRDRPSLPILGPADARAFVAGVRARALDVLATVDLDSDDPLLRDGFVYGMVAQHEHQHDETMLATIQLMDNFAHPDAAEWHPTPVLGSETAALRPFSFPESVAIDGGTFAIGTDEHAWVYDNERPRHQVELAPFRIDRTPVTNRQYRAFVDDGGYDDSRLWSDAGWEWRRDAGVEAPQFWQREGGGDWSRRRYGRREDLPPDEPVQHVCWHEANTFATWRGARLPTEAEWEAAASHEGEPGGPQQMLGDVWEWTASDFAGYPGFVSSPYREYSEVFFGPEYKVLRGGSWATDASVRRATFRNWDYPIRRQIFSGFRCAADA